LSAKRRFFIEGKDAELGEQYEGVKKVGKKILRIAELKLESVAVCTENLNPDVVMVKPAEDRV
jgi:hypothetical protein